MANKRIKDLTNTATEADLVAGNYFALDGGEGTKKLDSTTLLTKTAQNALAGNVAQAFDPTRTSENPYKAGESVAYDGKTYTFNVDHYGAWRAGDVVLSDGLEDKISEAVFKSFNVSVDGTDSQVHKYVFRRIKKDSKIIFSNVNWNSPSSGYPIRFDAYRKDGTSYQMGFNYQAVSAMTSSGVYVLTAFDDAEYLDLRLTATNGTLNSFSIEFADEYEQVLDNVSRKIDGTLSTGYTLRNRTKLKLKLQKDRVYDLSLSSSFSSSILSSSSLLIGIYVYSGNTYRGVLSINNDGTPIPLHNYVYFNEDDDYVFVDFALDVGLSVTLGVTDITERTAKLVPELFRQSYISGYADGSAPFYFITYDYAGRCTSQPSFLIPLVAGSVITSKKKNIGYSVLFFANDGAQTSDFKDSAEIVVSSDKKSIIGIKSPSGSEFVVEQLVRDTLIICPTYESKCLLDSQVNEFIKLQNFQKKFYAIEAINHRGYNDVAPENTLPAFRLSAVYGFDAVETDLRESSDGYFVLCHDATVDRTSNGTGNVADKTLEQLKALDFGSWKSAEYAGTKIPTLSEVLDCCYYLGVNLVIEIKYNISFSKIKELLSLIEEKRMTRNVEFISFDFAVLRSLAMYNNSIHLGFLNTAASISSDVKNRLRMLDNGVRKVSAVWETSVNLPSDDIVWLKSHGLYLERYAPGTNEAVLAVADTADGIISDRINAREFLKEYEINR